MAIAPLLARIGMHKRSSSAISPLNEKTKELETVKFDELLMPTTRPSPATLNNLKLGEFMATALATPSARNLKLLELDGAASTKFGCSVNTKSTAISDNSFIILFSFTSIGSLREYCLMSHYCFNIAQNIIV